MGPEHAPAEMAELRTEKVDHQLRLVAFALAVLDGALPDPEAQYDRLGLAAVDAKGTAQPRRPARVFALESDEVRARCTTFRHPLGVARVVPAIGQAVVVGVDLEIIDRRRPRALDQLFLCRTGRPLEHTACCHRDQSRGDDDGTIS